MFPERLKSLRLEAKLTQKKIADFFNTSPQSYAQWEKGLRKPTQESLEKLANYFNVSTDYLLGNTNIKNPETLDIDKEDLKKSLQKSVGFNGKPPTDEEVENMANAFLEYMANRKSN